MKYKLIIILLCPILGQVASARELVIVGPTNAPIANAKLIGYSQGLDSVATYMTNGSGTISIDTDSVRNLLAICPGYSEQLYTMGQLQGDTIRLNPNEELQELVVEEQNTTAFSKTYRLSREAMANYPTVLESLNEIPQVTVFPTGAVFYRGTSNIKLLVDGVEVSINEIQSLSKDDIGKVVVYNVPQGRYLSQGVRAVIDIRLKSTLHGGNVSLNANQSFYPLKGNNTAALYYNYSSSRFSVMYGNENRHYRKMRKSETLAYDFDGVHFLKYKEGLDSHEHIDDNMLQLGYQLNKPDKFLYNVRIGGSINRHDQNFRQSVHTDNRIYPANNVLKSNYKRYNISNYFEKSLGENGSSIIATINYQHYRTNYFSAYSEDTPDAGILADSRSAYAINLDGIFAELQYKLPSFSFGSFFLSAYEAYKHSQYADLQNPFYQKTNNFRFSADFLWFVQKLYGFLTFGAENCYSFWSNNPRADKFWLPTPQVGVTWRPTDAIDLSLQYSYSGNVPTIAQLSQTEQWLDNKLVYHGNATLKSYKSHKVELEFSFSSKIVEANINASYETAPNYICDMYTTAENYMLQTLVNLREYRISKAIMAFGIKPFGNSRLIIWNRINISHTKGTNTEYSWSSNRFQWMPYINFNIPHWTFQVYYQYPGKVTEGQLIRPRPQSWGVTAYYRPQSNLSIGLDLFMPFGKAFKESEYTVKAAPVYSDTQIEVWDRRNSVSLRLVYYLNFGRNQNRERPNINVGDSDSGILRK